MNYTNFPRQLIYRDRIDINEFSIDRAKTLNHLMYEKILTSKIMKMKDTEQIVPRMFNNAYYITILILMEKHPEIYLNRYLQIACNDNIDNEDSRYVKTATMAMVYNYLCHLDEKYRSKDSYFVQALFSSIFNDDASNEFLVTTEKLLQTRLRQSDFKQCSLSDIVHNEDETIILQGLDYVVSRIRSCKKEVAHEYYDTLIERLQGINIPGAEKGIKILKDDKEHNNYAFKVKEWVDEETGEFHFEPIEDGDTEITDLFDDMKEVYPCAHTETEFHHDNNHVESEIEKLKKELDKVKEEKEHFEEELREYMERNQNRRGINKHLVAVLGRKLAPKLGIDVKNKKDLAPVLSQLFGWGERKLGQEMSQPIKNEDELALANIFGSLSPELAKYIYPHWEEKSTSNSESPQTV